MLLAEALISFTAFYLLLSHLSGRVLRRMVGYVGITDTLLHGSVLYLFFQTSTDGLIQAEAAAIMFSLFLRGYRYAKGWERYDVKQMRWRRFAGHWM